MSASPRASQLSLHLTFLSVRDPTLRGLSQTVTVFETMESSVDPYICTFIVGVVQLLATGSKSVL